MRISALSVALWAVAVAALAAFPWLTNNYFIHIASLIGVFTIVAVGMNILVGMTGLVSLGHAGLFAVGAYTSALLGTRLDVSFWLSAGAAIVVTGAVGSVLALAALRARGIYLAMVTIAFGIIVEQVALDQDEFTGGFMGISSIPYPAIGDFTFSAPWRLYLIAVAGRSVPVARQQPATLALGPGAACGARELGGGGIARGLALPHGDDGIRPERGARGARRRAVRGPERLHRPQHLRLRPLHPDAAVRHPGWAGHGLGDRSSVPPSFSSFPSSSRASPRCAS